MSNAPRIEPADQRAALAEVPDRAQFSGKGAEDEWIPWPPAPASGPPHDARESSCSQVG
jgi:hypothetical protein